MKFNIISNSYIKKYFFSAKVTQKAILTALVYLEKWPWVITTNIFFLRIVGDGVTLNWIGRMKLREYPGQDYSWMLSLL